MPAAPDQASAARRKRGRDSSPRGDDDSDDDSTEIEAGSTDDAADTDDEFCFDVIPCLRCGWQTSIHSQWCSGCVNRMWKEGEPILETMEPMRETLKD